MYSKLGNVSVEDVKVRWDGTDVPTDMRWDGVAITQPSARSDVTSHYAKQRHTDGVPVMTP